MCGFAGSFGNLNFKLNDRKIFSSLKHRGPDSFGKCKIGMCVMYHSRLTIIGNSKHGLQPITNEKNTTTLVYNGEIYNWKELRNNFFPDEKKNIKSDTQILLRLFEKFGISFVNKLRGIFSFVIYSNKDKKIYLVRDRFGVKPLFYYKNNKNIFFATEIKSLLAMNLKKKLNLSVFKTYLMEAKLCQNNKTFFRNINSLEPATIYEISNFGEKKTKYWNLKNNEDHLDQDETEDLVIDSIKSNFIADTEVSVALSSGMDSSIIAYELLSSKKKLRSYSFGYINKKYNEIDDIKKNFKNKKNLVQNFKIMKSKDMLDKLQKAIYFFETPLGGLGTLSSFDLFNKVRQDNIKVSLSGEGADELFGGYKYYYLAWLKSLFLKKKFSELNEEINKYNKNNNKKLVKKNLNDFFNLKGEMYAPDGTSIYTRDNFFTKDFTNIQSSRNYNIKQQGENLTDEIYKDIFWRKLPKLLHFQDRASMANSVESRVPFLDHLLWDKVFSTNPKNLFSKHHTKKVIREIYTKRFKTLNAGKKYVSTPQREWLKNDLKDKIIEIIRYGKLVDNKIINFKNWKNNYDKYSNSKELGNSFFIWKILNAEFLFKEFF